MSCSPPKTAKPQWLAMKVPGGARYLDVKRRLKTLDLHTVCQSALCPNVGECWGGGTATILIMGDVCTRGCRFCAVKTGNPQGLLDAGEPERVATAIAELGLDYVVITSVDRDDLPDGGAVHFAATIRAVHEKAPNTHVEVLTPDFGGDETALQTLLESRPEVFAHNIECVRRLSPEVRDRRADYARSLGLLKAAKRLVPAILSKSSLMLGLGETEDDILATLHDLRAHEVDILTLGQYLQPSPRHLPVVRLLFARGIRGPGCAKPRPGLSLRGQRAFGAQQLPRRRAVRQRRFGRRTANPLNTRTPGPGGRHDLDL